MSSSGCILILKKISCTQFGRKYGDVGERLQKNVLPILQYTAYILPKW